MNRKKRFLALILSAVLIVSATAFTAMAGPWESVFRSFDQISAANGAKNGFTELWQRFLMCFDTGYANDIADAGGADGYFGSATKSCTIAYQKRRGLSADGIVGANTWGKMENDLDPLQVSYNVYFRCNTKNVMYMEQTTAKTQFYSYTDKGAKRTTPFLTTYG